MKKRLLFAFVAAAASVLPMSAVSFYYNYNGQNLKFEIIDSNAKTCRLAPYELFGTVPHSVKGELVIPEVAVRNNGGEYRVVEIGEKSFWNNEITSVVIPNSITKIDHAAFRATGLVSVTLPESLTEISSAVFDECWDLEQVNIPASVKVIGQEAFQHCYSLKSITLPPALEEIGGYAFAGCPGLSEIDIPETVKTIKYGAFRETGLKSVVIPESVTSCGARMFAYCGSLELVQLPASLTSIPAGILENCPKLTSIDIPESVTEIGETAFRQCAALTSVVLPQGLTTIGKEAFYGCSKIESMIIPEDVTAIGAYAFQKCTSLRVVTLSESLTALGMSAFDGCDLRSIYIPASVKTLEKYAFTDNPKLKSVLYGAQVPQAFDAGVFSNAAFEKATLYVAADAVESCKQLAPWNKFATVSAFTTEGMSEYKPLLENGKSWIIGRTNQHGSYLVSGCARIPSNQVIYNYEVIGDTVVLDTNCKVVACTDFGSGKVRAKYILKEEHGVVSLFRENYSKKPFIKILDFSARMGEEMSFIPYDIQEQLWEYSATNIKIEAEKFAVGNDGVVRREFVFNNDSWVEGVGASNDNWLAYSSIRPTSMDQTIDTYLLECRKDGKTIFSNKDFAYPSTRGFLSAKTIIPGRSWTMARGEEILTYTVDRDALMSNVHCRIIACSDGNEYAVIEDDGAVFGFSNINAVRPYSNSLPIFESGKVGETIWRVDGEACCYWREDHYWKISDIETTKVGSRSFSSYTITDPYNDDAVVASWVEGVGAPDAQSWATQMPEGYDLRMIDCRQDGEVIFTAEDFTHKSGIAEVTADRAERSGIYDLLGRRVATPTRGLYIVDGKKTLLR